MAIVRKKTLAPTNFITTDAAEILRFAERSAVATRPLDIEALIKLIGLSISYEEMGDDLSGYIENRSNSWVIGINQYQSKRRQRFTLAHELAHYLLHREVINNTRHNDKLFLRDDSKNRIEVEANDFASSLLMPKDNFLAAIQAGSKDITTLADIFDVSIAAARYRAFRLQLTASF